MCTGMVKTFPTVALKLIITDCHLSLLISCATEINLKNIVVRA